jgi:hypothetical protein
LNIAAPLVVFVADPKSAADALSRCSARWQASNELADGQLEDE